MADVTVRMSSENADLVRGWLEARRGVQSFEQELVKSGKAGRKAGADVKAGMDEAGGSINKSTAGISAATVAMGAFGMATTGVIALLNQMAATADAAAKSAQQVDKGSRKFTQLAGGDSAKLKALHEQRDALAMKYGMDREKTADAVYVGKSGGLSDEQIDTALKTSIVGADPEAAANFQGSIKSIYKGKVDPRAAMNVAMAASNDALNLEFDDFTKHGGQVLSAGDKLGLSMEETSAVFTETSATFGTGSTTADRLRNLFGKLGGEKEYQGKGMAGLKSFLGQSDEKIEKKFGKDLEFRAAVDALRKEMPDIESGAAKYRQVAAESGTDKDALDSSIRTHMSLPQNAAVIEQQRKEKRREVQVEKEGAVQRLGVWGVADDETARATKRDPLSQAQNYTVTNAAGYLTNDENAVRAASAVEESFNTQGMVKAGAALFGQKGQASDIVGGAGLFAGKATEATAAKEFGQRQADAQKDKNTLLQELIGKPAAPPQKTGGLLDVDEDRPSKIKLPEVRWAGEHGQVRVAPPRHESEPTPPTPPRPQANEFPTREGRPAVPAVPSNQASGSQDQIVKELQKVSATLSKQLDLQQRGIESSQKDKPQKVEIVNRGVAAPLPTGFGMLRDP